MTTTAETRSYRAALRSPTFRLFFAGQSVSLVGDGTVAVTFAFAALQISRSGWVLSAVLVALWLSRTLFVGWGGRVADRHDPARVAMLGDVTRLGAQMIPVVPFVLHQGKAWHLIVSAAVYGIGTAFFRPASVRLLPMMLETPSLQKANSLLGIASGIGGVAGPAVASLLIVSAGVPAALIFDALTYLASVATLAVVVRRMSAPDRAAGATPGRSDDEAATDGPQPTGAFRTLALFPAVAVVIGVWCVLDLGVGSLNVLGPVIANDAWGGVSSWASVVTMISVGSIVGGFAGGWLHFSRPVVGILLLVGLPMPIALVLLPQHVPLALICGSILLACSCFTAAGVYYDTFLQTAVPTSMLGRISAIESGFSGTARPLGTIICVPVADLIGRGAYFGVLGLMLCITAVTCCLLPTVRLQRSTRIS